MHHWLLWAWPPIHGDVVDSVPDGLEASDLFGIQLGAVSSRPCRPCLFFAGGAPSCLLAIAPDLDVVVTDDCDDRVSYNYHASVMYVKPADGGIPDWTVVPGYEVDRDAKHAP